MKKFYSAPEIEKILLEKGDVLSNSVGAFISDDDVWGENTRLW